MKTRIAFLLLATLLTVDMVMAQTPQAFKYQAVIRDTTGLALKNQPISLQVSIQKGDSIVEIIYTEIHNINTDEMGMVNLCIGEGFPIFGIFPEIQWGEDKYFTKVEIDMEGGTNYQLLGTSQLMAVPYALYAENSGNNHWEKGENGIHYGNGRVGIGTTNPITPLHIKGTSNLYQGREILLVQNNSNDEASHATIKLMSGNGSTSTKLQHTAESYEWEGRSELGMLGNDGQGLVLQATNEEGEIRFETGGAGLEKERMRITEDGKVGIGTTDPTNYKLRVETTADGGDERAIALFKNNSTATGSSCSVYIGSGESGSTCLSYFAPSYIHWGGKYKSHTSLQNRGKGLVFRTGQDDEGRIAFEFRREIGSSYTYDEKVSITYEGNLGIGITNPQHKLHIEGTNSQGENKTYLKLKNNSMDNYSNVEIRMFAGENNSCLALTHHAETYTGSQWGDYQDVSAIWNKGQGLVLRSSSTGRISFEVFDENANIFSEKMRMDGDGNFGIGILEPQRKLHINDVMRLEPRSTAPDNPAEGDIYMDSNDHVLKVYNGTEWKSCW